MMDLPLLTLYPLPIWLAVSRILRYIHEINNDNNNNQSLPPQ